MPGTELETTSDMLAENLKKGMEMLDTISQYLSSGVVPDVVKKTASMFLENLQLKYQVAELEGRMFDKNRIIGQLQAKLIKANIRIKKLEGTSGPASIDDVLLKGKKKK